MFAQKVFDRFLNSEGSSVKVALRQKKKAKSATYSLQIKNSVSAASLS